ncbi:hypothetical protein pb186bvf_002564 [Paramecium bursaria]
MLIFLLSICAFGAELSKREQGIREKHIKKIQESRVGNLILSMIEYDTSDKELNQFLESHQQDIIDEQKVLLEKHNKGQTNLLKQMQQVQQQLLDISEIIAQNQAKQQGPIEVEEKYYQQQSDRAQSLINDHYQKIDQKQVQLAKYKQNLGSKIDGYDAAIDQVDQMIDLIQKVAEDQEKSGLSFIQMKGKIQKSMDELSTLKLKAAKSETPMIKQIAQISIKNNFEDQASRKSLIDMLYKFRNKLVDDVNKLGGDDQVRINTLLKDIKLTQEEIDKLKQQVSEYNSFLHVSENKNKSIDIHSRQLEISRNRLQNELSQLKDQQRVENEQFQRRIQILNDEEQLLEEIDKSIKIIRKS